MTSPFIRLHPQDDVVIARGQLLRANTFTRKIWIWARVKVTSVAITQLVQM